MGAHVNKFPSIAAGWSSYNEMVIHPQAPQQQRQECRIAFYAGATVLFHAIMQCLDPGEEPTDADLSKMDAINREIEEFGKTFDAEVLKRHEGQQ